MTTQTQTQIDAHLASQHNVLSGFATLGASAATGKAAPIDAALMAYDLTAEGVSLRSTEVYGAYAKAHNAAIDAAPAGSALSMADKIGEKSGEGGFTGNASKIMACIAAAKAATDPAAFKATCLDIVSKTSGNKYENLLKLFRQRKDAKEDFGTDTAEAIVSGKDVRSDDEKARDELLGKKEKREKDMIDVIDDAVRRVLTAEDKLGGAKNAALQEMLQSLKKLATEQFPRS